MVSNLARRLESARKSSIVGRTAERTLFLEAAQSKELPFFVLYVYGPGGIGKSTLVAEFQRICAQEGIEYLHLDMRNIEPTPDKFIEAIRVGLNLDDSRSDAEAFASLTTRHVLLFDTFELAQHLEPWLRTTFLPQLPETILCVFAGRMMPSTAWRSDVGWQELMRVIALRNLSPDESRELLAHRLVPADAQKSIMDFTHGHPLALSLVADSFAQRENFVFEPEQSQDVVKTLLEQFVQHVPSPAHRALLEIASLVRITSEPLLESTLQSDDVHSLFEWLRTLSFMETHRSGVFPHDLAREAMVSDLRWRNPDWYLELHKRARNHYMARLSQSSTAEQQRILADYIYLHRDNPVIRPFFDWQVTAGYMMNEMQPEDYPFVKQMITTHEGDESAAIAKHWLSRRPQNVMVCRDSAKDVVGFMMTFPLHELAAEGEFDPAVSACWNYMQNHAPLRTGEVATLFRFWMSRDHYQGVSPIQTLIFVNVIRHYLTTPSLAYTFFPTADAEFWLPAFAYANIAHLPGAGFSMGGRSYGMFGADWRAIPPMKWLTLLAEREVGADNPSAVPAISTPLVVLSHEGFVEAVRDALRDFTRLDLLKLNPLLHSRFIASQSEDESERISLLQSNIRNTAEPLQASPRSAKAYRALYHTYFQPASTQEQAAELLDVPFSTYRRHLKTGIDTIVQQLWALYDVPQKSDSKIA
jgi:hypothetical protein